MTDEWKGLPGCGAQLWNSTRKICYSAYTHAFSMPGQRLFHIMWLLNLWEDCFIAVGFYLLFYCSNVLSFSPTVFIFHIVNHPRNIHTEEWHTIKGCEPLSDGAGITDGCTHRQCTLQVLLFGLSLLFPSSCQHFSNPPFLPFFSQIPLVCSLLPQVHM